MAALTITPNNQYTEYMKRWARVRAINNGEAKLKEYDLANIGGGYNKTSTAVKVSFLRLINPSDTSSYNRTRNQNYINGARLYNATVKTLSGLLGMLYRKPPTASELPDSINYILDNVDGSGLSMEQQSRSVSSDVTAIGRDGLLVDMPRNEEGKQITQADVANGFRASIQEYKAESIIDWHETVRNNVKVLDLVVLCETIEQYTDEMRIEREEKTQFKVYRLSEDNKVTVQIFVESSESGSGLEQTDQIEVVDSNNMALTAIPFVFVGSKNNQPSVDGLPLESVSDINIGHYQESANLASSSFQLSACQPVISDDNYARYAQDKTKKGESVELGEDSMIILGSQGKYALVSPPENNMSKAIQKDYEEQMIALGAQLITTGGGVETAEAARIKHASDVSDLEVISNNISNAYAKCLEWVCLFMGVEYDDYFFKLNNEFFDMKLTADDAVKLVSVWQGGAISKAVLDENLVKGKVISAEEDLEAMNDLIQEEQGGSVGFDGEPEE